MDYDIIFLNPFGFGYSGFSHGIATLSSILRNNGIKVSIIDASAEKLESKEVVLKVIREKPKIIGITGFIQASFFNKEVSDGIRNELPEVVQLAGGAWAEYTPEYILRKTKVDYVVRGEADLIITNLIKAIINNELPHNIPGTSFLDKEQNYTENPPLEFPRHLDNLPFPAYDLFDMSYYILNVKPEKYDFPLKKSLIRRIKKNSEDGNLRLVSITSGRGCYGRCDFCAAANLMRRNFSPQYLVDHMEYLMRTYNVNAFNFTESLTLSTRKWVKEFCDEIINRKLTVFYMPAARADFNYDSETIKLLEDSGCITIGFGFESGDNLMLRSFNKKTTVERYYKVIEDFKKTSIAVGGSFILNMPGENYVSIGNTIKFIKNTKIVFSFGFAYPYPGSSLYRFAESNSFCNLEDVMFKTLNKRLPSKTEFKEYIDKYNFNNLNKMKLWKVNKYLYKLFDYNVLYNKNIVLYFLIRLFPFYFEIKKGLIYLKDFTFIFLRKLAKFLKIKKIIHGLKFKK
ncbi:MAG: radical SAM protein [Actinobacteria bacterium]|nr:radical SAM protein [Actinomycetota bacterium]